jgi:hypothetical protein
MRNSRSSFNLPPWYGVIATDALARARFWLLLSALLILGGTGLMTVDLWGPFIIENRKTISVALMASGACCSFIGIIRMKVFSQNHRQGQS